MPRPKRVSLGYTRISDLIAGSEKVKKKDRTGTFAIDADTGEFVYEERKILIRGIYTFKLATDCNMRLAHSIPGSLREGTPAYEAAKAGSPLLHMAIARQRAKCFGPHRDLAEDDNLVASILAQRGLKINATGIYGETALHRCVEALDDETANTLIVMDIDRTIKNLNGKTAFDQAVDQYCYLVNRGEPEDPKHQPGYRDNLTKCHRLIELTTLPGKTPPSVAELEAEAARRATAAQAREAARVSRYRGAVFGQAAPRQSRGSVAARTPASHTAVTAPVTVAADVDVATETDEFDRRKQIVIIVIDDYIRYRPTTTSNCGHGIRRANSLKGAIQSAETAEAFEEIVADFLATGYARSLKGDGTGWTWFKPGASSKTDENSLRGSMADKLAINLERLNSKDTIQSALSQSFDDRTSTPGFKG